MSSNFDTVLEPNTLHCAPSDDDFTRRMRFHQSWYRHHVLQVPPGQNPHAGGARYGNMLQDTDADAGWNFINAEIYDCVTKRFHQEQDAGQVGRMRSNMLSSQPLCFNLFGPAARDRDWATALFTALDGVPQDIRVERVLFEFAPDRAQHLRDNTSFDAFVEYTRPDGRRGFIGIETKLTEPFSQDKYDFGDRYSRWLTKQGWWWRTGSEAEFSKKQFNQLWRNHLLTFAMLHQDVPTYSEGLCAVVYHQEDSACRPAIHAYRNHLRDEIQPTLLEWPLKDLLEHWKTKVATRQQREWFNAFWLRYLDLAASEPAWALYQRTQKRV
jgi:hypothetical protein